MGLVLAYVVMVLIGGVALWVVGKLFSADPPRIVPCFMGAAVAELVSLTGVPYIPFIVLLVVLIKVGGFEGMPAFFATILYGIMKMFLFGIIIATLVGIFG